MAWTAFSLRVSSELDAASFGIWETLRRPFSGKQVISSTNKLENKMVRLDARIVPNESLGGLRLRTKLLELQELVAGFLDPSSFRLISPFVAVYTLEGGAIKIDVDVRNGKVSMLSALSGYRGELFEKIHVGMKVKDAVAAEPRLYYDEFTESIVCKGVKGLAIDVPDIPLASDLQDKSLTFSDQVLEMNISSISVFAAEIESPRGNRGYW